MGAIDLATGHAMVAIGAGGAQYFSDVGPVGQVVSVVLDPKNANAADAGTERWTSATGARAFRVIPKGSAAAVASFTGLLVGWSTTAADLTAVNALMATMATGIATPGSGGTEVTNVSAMFPVISAGGQTGFNGALGWHVAAHGARIKTIAVRSTGAAWAAGVLLQVVT